jgi:hypothetical protein
MSQELSEVEEIDSVSEVKVAIKLTKWYIIIRGLACVVGLFSVFAFRTKDWLIFILTLAIFAFNILLLYRDLIIMAKLKRELLIATFIEELGKD